jgi:DDE superfamily endonuclease
VTKLLLGDNLSSHLSVEVIFAGRMTKFICVPANSTDKMQPLDVGVFGPMKNAWRKQLRGYADKDPSAKLLQKTEFPKMLNELLTTLDPGRLLPKARSLIVLWLKNF